MTKPSQRIERAFWAGFFLNLSGNALVQDWYGKEWYLNQVETGWLDIHWAFWPIPIICCLAVWLSQKHIADKVYRPRMEGEM